MFTGRAVRVCAGGTKGEHQGKKLQGRMRAVFLELAKERGFDRVVVETISPATEHIWRNKFGFTIRKQAAFRDFQNKAGDLPLDVDGNMTIFEKVLHRRPLVDGCCWCPFFCCGFCVRVTCCKCCLPPEGECKCCCFFC